MLPAEEITALLAGIVDIRTAAAKKVTQREIELRQIYYDSLAKDQDLRTFRAEAAQWESCLYERLAEVFLPGTVVKVWDQASSPSDRGSFSLGVVEKTESQAITILYIQGRHKRDVSPYSSAIELVSYDSLPEDTAASKKLKRQIGRLIAKVRLQEW
jgi:hypothetical protein